MSNIGNKETMAKNLKFYLDKSGRTQKELAEVVGVATSTFNDWVKAKKYPRIDKIEIMADYFGILKSDLIEEKSLNERIKENPARIAERHIEIIMDEDISDIFEDFKKLTPEEKTMVKKIVRSMANEEV